MKSHRPLPAELGEGSFTLRDAVAAQATRGRLQSRDLFIPSRGIRVPWGIEQEFHRIVAPVVSLGSQTVACFGTAARLWGLPIPAWMQSEQTLHIANANSNTQPVRFGVTGHRLKLLAIEVAEVRGVPVTSAARTWLDLSATLSLDELIAVGDAIVCRHKRSFGPEKRANAELGELGETIQRHGRSRGILKARQALELIRVGADSAPETFLRLAALRLGMPEPELNVVIRDSFGNEVAWPDLAYRESKIALQYDGRHHLDAKQQESDARRDNATAAAGWIPFRVNRTMVRQLGYAGLMRQVQRLRASR